MSKIAVLAEDENSEAFAVRNFEEAKKGKRHLFPEEIAVLEKNGNRSSDAEWKNIYVSEEFDPERICFSQFSGTVILGNLRRTKLCFHDLEMSTGIAFSFVSDCILGDDVCVKNVHYLVNYRIGSRVILFNIQEMSCTSHAKFGCGTLKEGERESDRIWIEIGNENGGRKILPFESMIPADAFLWSRFRDDEELQRRFVALTEYGWDTARNTMGIIADDVVIKNTLLLKDAKIGSCSYIKGAFKLKNITICSSEDEPSQIGEGVEMVNGILGYGSKVFYQAVAVRFVIGRNCQLKYGARLINSVLGDNSTVSCCEVLNNLLFPFHEQHHNSSFLIATTICGQSNIAAGATIGSNHNSRCPDGEIIANRGFWPGLCSDFKHNSRFASFTLVSKGSYPYELNIRYPFALIAMNGADQSLHVMPAYWFMHNMFAVARNNVKFKNRDRRVKKIQHIEMDPFAPDTMQEVFFAIERIVELTGRWLKANDEVVKVSGDLDVYQTAKFYLHKNSDSGLILSDSQCMKKYGAKILKPACAYKEYRKVMKYFTVKTLMEYCEAHGISVLTKKALSSIERQNLYTSWCNIGGQVIPEARVHELLNLIKLGKINNWDEVHAFYDDCAKSYLTDKTAYAMYLLEYLYSKGIELFTSDNFLDLYSDVREVSVYMYESSVRSRRKDYENYFRTITYRNEEEMISVIGQLESNEFLRQMKTDMDAFNLKLEQFFAELK
ncbi:MAG: DUF4954 family protein [Bacteroides sp.]|nr:DUF4954 family protein [Prevotella sp.]MCM1407109.1 DUF4954 family protein [Treponema brennaborense]MCM1470261.1 DUF4954 family protein [Bacteroides sp.]